MSGRRGERKRFHETLKPGDKVWIVAGTFFKGKPLYRQAEYVEHHSPRGFAYKPGVAAKEPPVVKLKDRAGPHHVHRELNEVYPTEQAARAALFTGLTFAIEKQKQVIRTEKQRLKDLQDMLQKVSPTGE